MIKFVCSKCKQVTQAKKIQSDDETSTVFTGVENDTLLLGEVERHSYRPSYFCVNCGFEIPKVDCDSALIEYIKQNGKNEE